MRGRITEDRGLWKEKWGAYAQVAGENTQKKNQKVDFSSF
jgi:hypothetical protein